MDNLNPFVMTNKICLNQTWTKIEILKTLSTNKMEVLELVSKECVLPHSYAVVCDSSQSDGLFF